MKSDLEQLKDFILLLAIAGILIWWDKLAALSASDFLMALFTFGLLVVAAVQSHISQISTKILKNQLETSNQQVRAYVFAEEISLLKLDDENQQLVIEILNSGHTPAYDVIVWSDAHWGEFKTDYNFDWLPPKGEHASRSKSVISPQQKKYIRTMIPLSEQDLDEMEREEKVLYVQGNISYRDCFGEQRSSNFKMVKSSFIVHEGRFFICPNGNECT